MALVDEHVQRLLEGKLAWGGWRRAFPLIRPALSGAQLAGRDLSGADLNGADLSGALLHNVYLSGANLSDADLGGANLGGASLRLAFLNGAYLSNANLSGANLSGADLRRADLRNANLSDAKLGNANLGDANLSDADLRNANLSDAKLGNANLRSANLSGADLSGASLYGTIVGDTDLTGVDGLETCIHHGPSIIDLWTMKKSWPLPLVFLRGVGLPNNLIEYLPSLVSEAIYYSCFISYSTKDDEFAKRINADLQNNGVRCWFAPHDLPIGAKILDEINAAIRQRDKVLLVLSAQSIGSDWVEDEVKTAFEEERKRGRTVLFPVRLDDAVMETKEAWASKLRADRNIGDFRQWKSHEDYQKTLERVLRDLKADRKSTSP